jgi:hypothetical protein
MGLLAPNKISSDEDEDEEEEDILELLRASINISCSEQDMAEIHSKTICVSSWFLQ